MLQEFNVTFYYDDTGVNAREYTERGVTLDTLQDAMAAHNNPEVYEIQVWQHDMQDKPLILFVK